MAAIQYIFKITQSCNLRCKYCYEKTECVSPKLKTHSPVMAGDRFGACLDAALRNAASEGHNYINVVLHGGEPLLVGILAMEDYIARMRFLEEKYKMRCYLCLQTNGLLLNEEWCLFLKKEIDSIGISLDGPKKIHDAKRITKAGKGTFDVVVKNIHMALEEGLNPGILAVIQPEANGAEVYKCFENLGIKRISFIIPAQNWEHSIFPSNQGHTVIADYLISVFDSWLNSAYMDIRVYLFEATIRAVYGLHPGIAIIGSTPAEWIIFTPDGSVELTDCYGICGFETVWREDPLDAIQICEQSKLYQLQKAGGFLPNNHKCRRCSLSSICGGGFLPHRYSKENGFNNPSYYCADLMKYFSHVITCLSEVNPCRGKL